MSVSAYSKSFIRIIDSGLNSFMHALKVRYVGYSSRNGLVFMSMFLLVHKIQSAKRNDGAVLRCHHRVHCLRII